MLLFVGTGLVEMDLADKPSVVEMDQMDTLLGVGIAATGFD